MAFKMKAGKQGPMKKNFPSVFKNNDGKTKVFGGRGTVNTSTAQGKKILNEIKNIPTVSSSDPNRITKLKKVAKGLGKFANKAFMGGIIDPTNKKDPRVTRSLTKPAPKGGA